MKADLTITIFIFTFLSIGLVLASDGDRSPFYQTCVKRCKNANCTQDDNFTPDAAKLLGFSSWLLQWGCRDECRYHCMWRTVDAFAERDYYLPKFHGKWPFARVLGVQEPASAFASLLNLAGHVYMHYELATQFSVKSAPLLLFWHGFAVVCENGWVWSTIFHARDTPFTEFMDYACALSMVMALLAAAIVRVFHGGKKRGPLTLLLFLFCYYVMHARYLYSGRIDYEFNMLVNVLCAMVHVCDVNGRLRDARLLLDNGSTSNFVTRDLCGQLGLARRSAGTMITGVCGGLLWAGWSCAQLLRGRRAAARMLVFALWSGAALALELLDFPPLLGWDAHALWHLATAPLPLIFYRFVIDDLKYLQNEKQPDKVDVKTS